MLAKGSTMETFQLSFLPRCLTNMDMYEEQLPKLCETGAPLSDKSEENAKNLMTTQNSEFIF